MKKVKLIIEVVIKRRTQKKVNPVGFKTEE